MKVKRKKVDSECDEGLEVKIKVRKTQIEKTDSDSENSDSDNANSENTDSEGTHSENTHSVKTHSENTDSDNTHSEKNDSDSIHSENTDSVSTHSENTDSDNPHSVNTDSKSTDSENTHSKSTHSENTYSENIDSGIYYSENTHSENTHSGKFDNENLFNERGGNEKNRCAVCNEDDHEPDCCKEWGYPSTNWPIICPDFCDGNSQSPIDIDSSTTDDEQSEFTYTNYDQTIPNVNIKNNGHSVTVSWDTSVNTPSISDGGLDSDYTLAQFHFHWGCENDRGSEHTINGQSYAMELHLVHYKTSYGSLGEAIKHPDGLAVLGVFFDVGSEDSTLKPITDNLSQITEPGANEDIVFDMKIENLIPSIAVFYRYAGSLTTPTCNEVVVWSVFAEKLEVSQDQIEAFRSLKDHHGASLCDNYREVQPLNGRTVYAYNQ